VKAKQWKRKQAELSGYVNKTRRLHLWLLRSCLSPCSGLLISKKKCAEWLRRRMRPKLSSTKRVQISAKRKCQAPLSLGL
jgi:hypothetical protein